jgi:hypothetical protein
MAYTPDELKGRLYDNRPEKTRDNQPDYKGLFTLNGVTYRMAAWYSPPNERHELAMLSLSIDQPRSEQHDETNAPAPRDARAQRSDDSQRPGGRQELRPDHGYHEGDDDDIPY